MNYLIISCIGPDRTGIVDSISSIIKKHNGNWQVSSLHHLSGFFAGVIEVSVTPEQTESLTNDLLEINGLSCQVKLAEPNLPKQKSNLALDLTANDRPGIVQEISSVIHHEGGNLVKLVSSQGSAPHTGQLVFKAKVRIAINDESIDDLIEALEKIADDLIVDITR